jgi:hypothetical protein
VKYFFWGLSFFSYNITLFSSEIVHKKKETIENINKTAFKPIAVP